MLTRGGGGGGREEIHTREIVSRYEYGVFDVYAYPRGPGGESVRPI